MAKIGIIGAGIKGLTTAYKQELLGNEVFLFEQSDRVGGALVSKQHDSGYLTEDGAHTLLLNSSELERFIHSFDSLKSSFIESNPLTKNRFILKNNNLYPIQPTPTSVLTSKLLPIKSRLKIISEIFKKPKIRDTDLSLKDFFIEHFGEAFTDYLINPFIAGTYAGQPKYLSTENTFPSLLNYERQYGSILKGLIRNKSSFKNKIISFQSGLSELPIAIAAKLKNKPILESQILDISKENNGWKMCIKSKELISSDWYFDELYCTLPAFKISQLPFADCIKKDCPKFESIDHPPVSVLSVGYHKSEIQHPLNGFGYLIPEVENKKHLGGLFTSKIFPNRAPENHELLTFFIGGSRSPESASSDTDKLIYELAPSLSKILGINSKPRFIYQRFWGQSIPQYNLGHSQFLNRITDFEKKYENFFFVGNYKQGISLSQSIL